MPLIARFHVGSIALAALFGLLLNTPIEGKSLRRQADNPPPPATPPAEASEPAAQPADAGGVPVIDGCGPDCKPCCYTPCISYHTRRACRSCCAVPTYKAVLRLCDPCCRCALDVPVCLPTCCQGTPCVKSHCGLLGRGIVDYQWECGFRIRIVISKHGDVRVTYIHS